MFYRVIIIIIFVQLAKYFPYQQIPLHSYIHPVQNLPSSKAYNSCTKIERVTTTYISARQTKKYEKQACSSDH